MRFASLSLVLLAGVLSGCAGDPVETETSGDGDTDADSDSDTDADTDTDTSADTDTAIDTDTGPAPHLIVAFEVPVTAEVGNETIDQASPWAVRGPTHTGAITSVDLYLRGAGATGDALTVALVGDANGPTGASLGSATIASSSFSESTFSWATATFDPPVAVDGAFWIIVSVPALSTSTYTAIAWNTGNADQLAMMDGGWSIYSKTYEWPHRVYGTP